MCRPRRNKFKEAVVILEVYLAYGVFMENEGLAQVVNMSKFFLKNLKASNE